MSSAAPRSLPTATAAGALLIALWFIPTAHAPADRMTPAADAASGTAAVVQSASPSSLKDLGGTPSAVPGSGAATLTTSGEAGAHADKAGERLADSGNARTTLHLFGATVLLGLGAGSVTYAMRRGHGLAR